MEHFASRAAEFSAAYRTEGSAGRLSWHGHNFTLRARLAGPPDDSRVVLSSAAWSALLRAALEPFDHARLDDAPAPAAALAALAAQLRASLAAGLPAGPSLVQLDLTQPHLGISLSESQTLFRHPGEFSAAHRTHAPRLTPAANLALYGICNNPAGHGHNYRAAIWHPDPEAVPASLWAEFDHRNLSVDIPDLQHRNVVTEAIAALLAQRVPGAARIRVWETPAFFAEFHPALGAYRLGRRYSFSAAHQLAAPGTDPAAAQSLYGRCGLPGIHGHDFDVLVIVGGELDVTTEAAFDLGELDRLAAARLAPLQHVNLSADVPALAARPATGLSLAQHLFVQFRAGLGSALCAVGVSATPGRWSWTSKGTHG